jgi:uncharacterized repeat protein (TIGR01451 family)
MANADTSRRARLFRWLIAQSALAIVLSAAGCQFPAIDQSGQRIFSGGTTPLAHHDHGLFHHRGPAPAAGPVIVAPPAAVTPVVPAPAVAAPTCNPPVVVGPVQPAPQPLVAVPAVPVIPIQPVACGPQGNIQQTPLPPKIQVSGPVCPDANCPPAGPVLQVTPSRLVAPVNTEVLLAAGITDGRGYYVLRQPLEWMLAPDGVGHVMAVGKESHKGVSYALRHSPQKVDTDYVRAHTSTIEQTIDRGTPNPNDDVLLQKGQSFITVTSPTEGTSHVTVWAPKEHNWDRRQATATIHWVDARWQFPPCASGRAGQKQVLQTVVTRSDGAPVSGWIVRYEVVEGPEAVLTARGDRVAEVRTDGAGRATVDLLPRSLEPGITTVAIQVIRPAARGDLPQMVVGQGQTCVSWSTPGLAVTAIGPSTVAADGAVNYRVEVTNNGDLPTRGVVLSYTPPTGVTLLNSTPAAQAFGQRFQWTIGDLPGRTTVPIEVNCRAAVAADIRSCFRAESADGLSAEGCATTRVFANALSVRMTGPEAVEVGREAQFLVDITNTGSTTLTGLVATDTFDPGLSHVGGEPSPLRKAIVQPLAPGDTAKIALSFIVTQPGRHTHRLDVTAEGGHAAGARAVVTGTPAASAPPPVTPARLDVRVTGPRTQRAGEIAEYIVEVTNRGASAATNVTIDVLYGINLKLEAASGQFDEQPERRTMTWRVPQIAAGATVRKQFNCLCLNADDVPATVRITVASDQTRTAPQAAEARTTITPGATRPPVDPTRDPTGRAPVEPPAAGDLKVTIRELADPIVVGGKTTYIVEILNDRQVSDRDVTLKLEIPEGMQFATNRGPTEIVGVSRDGRTVEMKPVAEIRAGEALAAYQVEVSGQRPGKYKVRATVTSVRTPVGVSVEAETTVNAP